MLKIIIRGRFYRLEIEVYIDTKQNYCFAYNRPKVTVYSNEFSGNSLMIPVV